MTMIVDSKKELIKQVLHQFEEWIGNPENPVVRNLYIGMLQRLAEFPRYDVDQQQLIEASKAADGCQTVGELLQVNIGRRCYYVTTDSDGISVDNYVSVRLYLYIMSTLYAEWLTDHKQEILELLGPDWEDMFENPNELWQDFLSGGDLEMDPELVLEQLAPINFWSMAQLYAEKGVCPFTDEELRSCLFY